MVLGQPDTKGGQSNKQHRSLQPVDPSPRTEIRDPFSSQSSEDHDGDLRDESLRDESLFLSLSPRVPLELPEQTGSPGSSMDRNMAELAESIFSQSSPAHGEPSPQPVPKQDIQSFGLRLDTIETKVEGTVARVN